VLVQQVEELAAVLLQVVEVQLQQVVVLLNPQQMQVELKNQQQVVAHLPQVEV
jgi:translation initiation factor IF-1